METSSWGSDGLRRLPHYRVGVAPSLQYGVREGREASEAGAPSLMNRAEGPILCSLQEVDDAGQIV